MTRRRKLAEAKPPQPQPSAGGPMTRRRKLAEAKPPQPQPRDGGPMTRRRKLAEAKPPQPQPPAGGPMARRRKLSESEPPPEDLLSAPPEDLLSAPPQDLLSAPPQDHLSAPPEAEDRLSALPDGVLGVIISLLPTKDGARTQILASQWRHLWHSSPLNIDYRDLTGADKNNRSRVAAEAISRIFSAHQIKATRRLSIKTDRGLLNFPSDPQQDAWLDSPTLNGLQEIEFWFYSYYLPLPLSIYRFSATLRVATFGRCLIPDDAVHGLSFPNLKQLALEKLNISEPSLHSLIAGCPELEGLRIRRNIGFRRLRIDSLTLTSICVREEVQLEELVVHNAPRLERLIRLPHFLGSLRVSVISAPKLHTLGFLIDKDYWRKNTTLLFGSSVIQVFTHPNN
jgi:hypothetical protein